MDTLKSTTRTAVICTALGLAGLFASMQVGAQSLRVTAANASNSAVYDVTFAGSGGFTTVLNNDQNLHVSLRSLVFIPNEATGKIDLLVADASSGEIVRYADAKGTATLVWSAAQGAGPRYPDGLSVDADGNLFVASSGAGKKKPAQLWVFPSNNSVPNGAAFLAPRLVDESFGGRAVQGLEETLIARGSSAASGAGDLLILASDPAVVLVYSAASVQGVLNGGGPINPSRALISGAQFPKGVIPGGMDFWPLDNSLLITTATGTVLRYSFTATSATRRPDFATGLGNGKFKIKSGREASEVFAFVANNNGGQILKFGAPPANGSNPPLSIVTAGVQHPQGLAASNLAATNAADCLESAGGCDLLGGVISHSVRGLPAASGYLIEDTCVVEVDPRIAEFGTCTGHSLPVAQVCAGYGATVIPDFMCGASGNSGSGFALVKSTSNSLSTAKGALIANEGYAENVLSGPNPPCPQMVLGWAPTADEGTVIEGNMMVELTSGCGSSRSLSRGLSVWGVGLELNEDALPGKNVPHAHVQFAIAKFNSLRDTITAVSIEPSVMTLLTDCVDVSRDLFDEGYSANAASQLVSCDGIVASNEGAFTATSSNPNPSGEIRSRLANLHLQINSRILLNPPAWPTP